GGGRRGGGGGPRPPAALAVRRLGVSRQGDQEDSFPQRGADLLGQPPAVQPREVDVRDDRVRPPPERLADAGGAVAGGADLAALGRQQPDQRLARGIVIFHDHHSGPPRPQHPPPPAPPPRPPP